MNKRILLISGNFAPEPTGIGKYNGELIDLLAKEGNICTVVTSFPYYPHWKIQEPYSKNSFWYKKEFKYGEHEDSIPIEIYRCPQYVPSKPTTKRRMLLDFTFCFFALFKVIQLFFKPKYDFVIAVVPCFQVGLLGVLYKKIKGGKFLYHIQDLQIDVARDLKMIKSKTLIRFLFSVEKYILKNADLVSSISPGMISRIKNKYNRDVFHFPNWVNINHFYPLEGKEKLKREFNFIGSDKIILYSGAIGEKQGLEAIVKAARVLQRNDRLKFVICGSGPYTDKLQLLGEKYKLKNLFFLPLQPSDQLNHFLNMADIHLVVQRAQASDLVMPSKLTNILSVGGNVIITANMNSNLYETVKSHNIGIVVEPGNYLAIVSAINNLLEDDTRVINRNARVYAEKFLSLEVVISKYITKLNNVGVIN